jgi:hypothetical protein
MCIRVIISAPWVEYVCALHMCFHSMSLQSSWKWVLHKQKLQYQLSWNIQQIKRVRSQLIQILLINLSGIFQKCEKKFELNLWQWYLLTVSKSELLPSLQCPQTRHWWAASTVGICSFLRQDSAVFIQIAQQTLFGLLHCICLCLWCLSFYWL